MATLPQKLRKARLDRGFTYYAAVQRMRGVGQQQLINLEGGPGATRDTDPADLKLWTVLEICRVYWPDVELQDFAPGILFRLAGLDSNANRTLKGYAATG